MKKQIKEVQDYFKNKLFSNDFDIAKIGEYNIELVIDEDYKFVFWIGNIDIPHTRKQNSDKISFMDLQFANDEAVKFHELLLPVINQYRKDTLLIQKRNELEQLENELSAI